MNLACAPLSRKMFWKNTFCIKFGRIDENNCRTKNNGNYHILSTNKKCITLSFSVMLTKSKQLGRPLMLKDKQTAFFLAFIDTHNDWLTELGDLRWTWLFTGYNWQSKRRVVPKCGGDWQLQQQHKQLMTLVKLILLRKMIITRFKHKKLW